jgi:hypothetical protein
VREDFPAADSILSRANVVIRGKAGALQPVLVPRAEPPEALQCLVSDGVAA